MCGFWVWEFCFLFVFFACFFCFFLQNIKIKTGNGSYNFIFLNCKMLP